MCPVPSSDLACSVLQICDRFLFFCASDSHVGVVSAMQWQFPAFMSFKTAREEGTKEFSISGFRPPAVADAFDGIKKHASSPVTSQQVRLNSDDYILLVRCSHADAEGLHSLLLLVPMQKHFGFDTPVTTQQYGHRAQGSHHLLGGSRMVQPLPFNQASPMLRTQSFHNTSSGMFKSQPFAMSNGLGGSTVGAYGARYKQ